MLRRIQPGGPTTRVALLVVLCATAACGTTGVGGVGTRVLTYEEMAASGASTLYDAVQRLRPRWLQIRSARSLDLPHEVVVYRGPSYVGSVDVLRTYRVESVTHLEYLDGATAAATLTGYGSRHVEAAIILRWETEERPRTTTAPPAGSYGSGCGEPPRRASPTIRPECGSWLPVWFQE